MPRPYYGPRHPLSRGAGELLAKLQAEDREMATLYLMLADELADLLLEERIYARTLMAAVMAKTGMLNLGLAAPCEIDE